MLIITADDYGKNKQCTDSILKCLSNERITSASAMVFMEDSVRAAALALESNLEVGLHLNFTLPFNIEYIPTKLSQHHNRIISYLTKHKISQLIYNPLLANSFQFVFLSQQEEFTRLYGREPDYYNGHHHMHLSANMLVTKLIPKDARIRKTFTFDKGEKNPFNRFYRHVLDKYVQGRYISTDYFFSIASVQNKERLRNIFKLADKYIVELEVHPDNAEEASMLLSDPFRFLMDSVQVMGFRQLNER